MDQLVLMERMFTGHFAAKFFPSSWGMRSIFLYAPMIGRRLCTEHGPWGVDNMGQPYGTASPHQQNENL